MKGKTKSKLSSCVKNSIFGNTRFGKNRYDIYSLYKLYSLYECKDLADLLYKWNNFCEFILKKKNKIIESAIKNQISFRDINFNLKSQVKDEIEEQLYDLKRKIQFVFNPDNSHEKRIFSGVVGEIIKGTNSSVLDVGSGPVPDTSFMLAEKAKKVFAMDDFIVALEFIKKRGVEPIEDMFDDKTNIDNYNIVVGKTPCSAIKSIVKVCSKTNTPYFIKLCDCDLENQTMSNGAVPYSWKEFLPEIDRNIKFFRKYAYNLDISKSQLEKLISRYQYEENENSFLEFISFIEGISEQEIIMRMHEFGDSFD